MAPTLIPVVPPQWNGDHESFVRCLSDFAAEVLEIVSSRCDALQHFDTQDDRNVAYNQGVIAATRIVMQLASMLKDTQRPPNEWTASNAQDLDGA